MRILYLLLFSFSSQGNHMCAGNPVLNSWGCWNRISCFFDEYNSRYLFLEENGDVWLADSVIPFEMVQDSKAQAAPTAILGKY
ncbi:hypothetical protein C8R43DRAFT_1040926 [Mycena crocata]|nr:hypothetical protein C8R43DRAFT_1040926 [Mycena crocata]